MNLRPSWTIPALLAWTLLASCSSPRQSIRVESYPPGARVLLDDRDTGLVTPTNLELSTKDERNLIRLEKKGYNPVVREVRLGKDVEVMSGEEALGRVLCAPCCLGLTLPGLLTPIHVEERFYPNPLIASLDPEGQGMQLWLEPGDAEIFVDGRLQRLLDASFLVMEPGDHDVEIRAPGRRTWQRVVQVSPSQYSDLEITLEPEGQGWVFDVQPPDVQLFIDEQYRGTLAEGSTRIKATPGPHQVRIDREGHRSFEAVLVVEVDEYREEKIRLEVAGQGLLVRRPEGVTRDAIPQIMIDGVLRSTAFDEPLRLDPGPYLLEVELPGRGKFQRKVMVEANNFHTVDLPPMRDL